MTERSQLILDLVEAIKPLLAGHPPQVQGAALADLTAIWLAGHPPQARSEILALQVKTIIGLIRANEGIMFGPAGHPSTYAGN